MDNLNPRYLVKKVDLLRSVLLKSGFLVISASGVAYIFRKKILLTLQQPLKQENLIFIHPAEAFFTYIKISLFAGLLVATPYLIFQLIKLICNLSKKKKRKTSGFYLAILTIIGSLFFYAGAGFGFKAVLPLAISFLKGVSGEKMVANFTVNNYVSFTMSFTLIFGFLFELPFITYGLTNLGLLSRETLISKWRFVVAGAAITAAILTPPDPVTQLFLWVPLLLLYGVSIVLVSIADKE